MISSDLRAQIRVLEDWFGPLVYARFGARDQACYKSLYHNLVDVLYQLEAWERGSGPAACVAQAPQALPPGVIDLARVRHLKELRGACSFLDGSGPHPKGAA